MKYIKGLDGIRAIAVSMVILQHYYYDYLISKSNSIGSLGVGVFFVLSGFLITQILLHEKDKVGESIIRKYSKFTIRRSIRIFPLYYVVLIFGMTSGIYWFSEINQLWHALYATNIYMFIHGDWTGYTVHFWSLDVEEQFYIIWPLVVLLTPRRNLFNVFLATIFIGPLSLALKPFLGINGISAYVLPFSHLDSLGLGSMLALYVSREGSIARVSRGSLLLISTFSALTYFLYEVYKDHNMIETMHYISKVAVNALTCAIILYLIQNQSGRLTFLLEMKPLKFIGGISYGIYLIHKLTPEIYVHTSFTPVDTHLWVNIVIWLTTTVALASASWFFIEKPLISNKGKIEIFFLNFLPSRKKLNNSRH